MGKIVIIGPRSSGKTTFLVGLAYWPSKHRNSIYSVEKGNASVNTLIEMAENLLMEQESTEGTNIPANKRLTTYSFFVEIKRGLKKPETIDLSVKDYPGGLFQDLENCASGKGLQHPEFWQECFKIENDGCLILLPEGFELFERDKDTDILIKKKADDEYKKCMKGFFQLMDRYKKDGKISPNFRVAVAMGKCERGELWPGRLEPEIDLFNLYLKKTTKEIRHFFANQPKNLRFYAVSTFGVMSKTDPRPNCQQILGEDSRESGVLRNSDVWQPYNLIAPLYWLSTGKIINSHAR